MTKFTPQERSQLLARFGDGSTWGKMLPDGRMCPEGTRCLGLMLVDLFGTDSGWTRAYELAHALGFGSGGEIFRWNDAPERTAADIRSLIESVPVEDV